MKFNQLTNQEVRELEQSSIPIESFIHTSDRDARFKRLILTQHWYHTHDLNTSMPQKRLNAKMTSLLNINPNYYKTYEFKNAVWGINWQSHKIIIYLSRRGLSIQVEDTLPQNSANKFLDDFNNLIVNRDNMHPDFKEMIDNL